VKSLFLDSYEGLVAIDSFFHGLSPQSINDVSTDFFLRKEASLDMRNSSGLEQNCAIIRARGVTLVRRLEPFEDALLVKVALLVWNELHCLDLDVLEVFDADGACRVFEARCLWWTGLESVFRGTLLELAQKR
jgi:hypothetical protein